MRVKSMNCRGFARSLLAAGALLLLAALAVPALSATDGAQGPRIRDLVVVEKHRQLLVFGTMESAFPPSLIEVVQSGVNTRFVFSLGLVRSRRFIYDTEVASRQVVHQVKYDALKKAYTFQERIGAEETRQQVTQSLQDIIDWMSEINGLPIAAVQDLDPGYRYYVRVRARLNSVDFSFPFNYLLAFLGQKSEWAYSSAFGPRGM